MDMRTGAVTPHIGRFKKAKPKAGKRRSWEAKALSKITIVNPSTHPHLYK